jgi:hypothetical protein
MLVVEANGAILDGLLSGLPGWEATPDAGVRFAAEPPICGVAKLRPSRRY